MELKLRLTRTRVALLIAMASAIVAGVAYAAIPDSAGVIHGCYDKNNLRVIDPSTGGACKQNETALNWNQTGPTGPAGPMGPSGPTGATGATGTPGRPGIGATSGSATFEEPTHDQVLATTNGIALVGDCGIGGARIDVQPEHRGQVLQAWGTLSASPLLVDPIDDTGGGDIPQGPSHSVAIDGVARVVASDGSSTGSFVRIDLHGHEDSITEPCSFSWMIIPSN